MSVDCHFEEPTAIRSHIGAIFVSLELSRSNWAGHLDVAWDRREDVEAQRAIW
jgi:hypothetical protein